MITLVLSLIVYNSITNNTQYREWTCVNVIIRQGGAEISFLVKHYAPENNNLSGRIIVIATA